MVQFVASLPSCGSLVMIPSWYFSFAGGRSQNTVNQICSVLGGGTYKVLTYIKIIYIHNIIYIIIFKNKHGSNCSLLSGLGQHGWASVAMNGTACVPVPGT